MHISRAVTERCRKLSTTLKIHWTVDSTQTSIHLPAAASKGCSHPEESPKAKTTYNNLMESERIQSESSTLAADGQNLLDWVKSHGRRLVGEAMTDSLEGGGRKTIWISQQSGLIVVFFIYRFTSLCIKEKKNLLYHLKINRNRKWAELLHHCLLLSSNQSMPLKTISTSMYFIKCLVFYQK